MRSSTRQHQNASDLTARPARRRSRSKARLSGRGEISVPSSAFWLTAAAACVIALTASVTAGAASGHPERSQRSIARQSSVSVNDHASLHMVKAYGETLVEEGYASGTLPGRTWVRMAIGSKVSASFTIWTKGGSINGRGGASLHSSSRYASFGGWLLVSGGGGRFAHAHGTGRLYGVLDRRTHAVTVKTVGTLFY